MTNFLPYAIIAGIAIVFFVICYIMYSGGGHSESSLQTEKKGNTKTKTRYDGEPQPLRRVQHRSPATVKHARQLPKEADDEETAPLPQVPKMTLGERREHPEETAFVTTKGEAVRRNSRIVYKEAPKAQEPPVHKGPNADDLDATRVLSRDEILEAMEKVDKEEAAAYKAREEEAKLARQRQAEQEKEAQEQQLARNRERREQARREAAAAKEANARREERARWAEEVAQTEEDKPPLADMAAIVSADLAAKDGGAAPAARKQAAPAAEPAASETEAPKDTHRKHILRDVMAETAKAAGTAKAVTDAPSAAKKRAVSEATQVLEGPVVSEGMKAVASQLEQTQRMEPIHIDSAMTAKKKAVPEETMVMPPIRAHKSQERRHLSSSRHRSSNRPRRRGIPIRPGPIRATRRWAMRRTMRPYGNRKAPSIRLSSASASLTSCASTASFRRNCSSRRNTSRRLPLTRSAARPIRNGSRPWHRSSSRKLCRTSRKPMPLIPMITSAPLPCRPFTISSTARPFRRATWSPSMP